MVRAVIERDPDIHDGEPAKETFVHSLHDPLLDGRNEVPGNGAPDDRIHKLEAASMF